MATVEMSFTPLPAHVRTARLVATAMARRSGVEEALLDEVRLAVGEACSRAVEAHQLRCPDEPVRLALGGTDGRFEVIVTDAAAPPDQPASDAAPDQATAAALGPRQELGLAVIAGLADDIEIARGETGLSIRMSWPAGKANPAGQASPVGPAGPAGQATEIT